jgi:hypothetical protein
MYQNNVKIHVNGKRIKFFDEIEIVNSLVIEFKEQSIMMQTSRGIEEVVVNLRMSTDDAKAFSEWLYSLTQKLTIPHLIYNGIFVPKEDIKKYKIGNRNK